MAGKVGGRNGAGDFENAEIRRVEVLSLRIQGKSYRKIAAELNVSAATVCNDIKRCLENLAKQQSDKTEELRQLELERIDVALEKMFPHLDRVIAVDRWVKLIELRAKILGLLAPTKVAPTTPEGDQPYSGLTDEQLIAAAAAVVEKRSSGTD